jgi:hypothetical protein
MDMIEKIHDYLPFFFLNDVRHRHSSLQYDHQYGEQGRIRHDESNKGQKIFLKNFHFSLTFV